MRSNTTYRTHTKKRKPSIPAKRESLDFEVRFGGRGATGSERKGIPHLRLSADWASTGKGAARSQVVMDAICAVIAEVSEVPARARSTVRRGKRGEE